MTGMALQSAKKGLAARFLAVRPGVKIDSKFYLADFHQNLLDDVRPEDFEDDLRQGDGNELAGKFRAIHSSSALAVNHFAPFRDPPRMASLQLPGGAEFTARQFEKKCPHGLAGRKSPNLDVLVEGPEIVAIESKCLEYLSPHVAEFAPIYKHGITDERRDSPWFEEMLRLRKDPHRYRWLHVAQLIKHTFGLAHTFPGRAVMLLYLFWEPENPESYRIFEQHRMEIKCFSDVVGGGFCAASYPEIWRLWAESGPPWLAKHVDRLRARYSVKL